MADNNAPSMPQNAGMTRQLKVSKAQLHLIRTDYYQLRVNYHQQRIDCYLHIKVLIAKLDQSQAAYGQLQAD
jgi:hypothetical protein